MTIAAPRANSGETVTALARGPLLVLRSRMVIRAAEVSHDEDAVIVAGVFELDRFNRFDLEEAKRVREVPVPRPRAHPVRGVVVTDQPFLIPRALDELEAVRRATENMARTQPLSP